MTALFLSKHDETNTEFKKILLIYHVCCTCFCHAYTAKTGFDVILYM